MKVSLDRAKENLFIALGIDIVFSLLIGVSFIWIVDIVGDVKSGVYQVTQSLVGRIDFLDMFSVSRYFVSIAVFIMIMLWTKKCYGYAKEVLKQTGFKQESWYIWGWIIPFVSWIKPYQIINEIYKAGVAKRDGYGQWQNSPSSAWLMAWWAFWLMTIVVYLALTKALQIQQNPLANHDEIYVIKYSYWMITNCLTTIVIDALLFVVVGRLTGNLINK